jgi:C4-dicarboxylate-specific signal transduction histidine kinase
MDFNDVVHRALALVTSQLTSHGIRTEVRLAPSSPAILGNPLHIEQIVINLIHNAMNALDGISRRDKLIHIETSRENDTVKLVVADNGTGLPDGVGEQLFDPFFSTRKNGEGTGLGLAIVKRFVEEHKGQIQYADNPSGGATFTISFPDCAEKAAQE